MRNYETENGCIYMMTVRNNFTELEDVEETAGLADRNYKDSSDNIFIVNEFIM